MAPDLNSLDSLLKTPQSEHSHYQPLQTRTPSYSALSSTNPRRTSQTMAPPSASADRMHMPHRVSSGHEQDGPLRHPRPLTAAELYSECEKEQEAVVNRLTRELTALRAQSASVASNTSHSSNSTSASLLPNDITDPNPTHQMMGGATHPTPSRHRSSSSLSARSGTGSTHAHAGSTAPSHPGSHGGFSQASYDRAAAATGGTTSTTISRQPSISAQSGASTPARQSLDAFRHPSSTAGGIASGGTPYTLPHRPSLSRDHSYAASTTATAGTPHYGPQSPPTPGQSPSPNVQIAMQHYTDTAAYRSEMELVKAENDSLRQRVRALEQALRTRRRDSSTSQADSRAPDAAAMIRATTRERDICVGGGTSPSASSPNTTTTSAAAAGIAAWAAGNGGVRGVAGPRERSESQSTTASSRRGLVGGGVYVGEDEVRFGESAGNVGIGR